MFEARVNAFFQIQYVTCSCNENILRCTFVQVFILMNLIEFHVSHFIQENEKDVQGGWANFFNTR